MKNANKFIVVTVLSILVFSVFINNAESKNISLSEAVQIVKSKYSGEVIKVEKEGGMYGFKIIEKNGKIIKVYVNPIDGSLGKQNIYSIDDAINKVKKTFPGEIVKIEFEKGMYEIKIRQLNGMVNEVYLHGQTLDVIKNKIERD